GSPTIDSARWSVPLSCCTLERHSPRTNCASSLRHESPSTRFLRRSGSSPNNCRVMPTASSSSANYAPNCSAPELRVRSSTLEQQRLAGTPDTSVDIEQRRVRHAHASNTVMCGAGHSDPIATKRSEEMNGQIRVDE